LSTLSRLSQRLVFLGSRACCLLLIWCLASACQSQLLSTSDQAAFDQLLSLIQQRLELAPLVARAKWNTHGAINDPPREAQIRDQVAHEGEQLGLPPAAVRIFFQAQFDAGKLIQQDLHQRWQQQAQPPFQPATDLAREVRPVLDALNPQLLQALQRNRQALCQPAAQAYLAQQARQKFDPDWPPEVRKTALAGLACF
jgi:chorismate mutase